MKKLLSFLCLNILLLQAQAQQWSGATDLNGTLYRNGNVGIGTASPAAKLSVSSNYSTTALGNYSEITIDNLGSGNFYGSSIRNIYTANNPAALNPRLAFLVQNTNTYSYSDLIERMTILGNGNIGIATTSPQAQLDVNGTFRLGVGGGAGGTAYAIAFTRAGNAQLHGNTAAGLLLGGDGTGTDMTILPSGKIGIGTSNPSEMLSVKGNVIAQKIKVSTNLLDWPDYVFEPSYNLRSLQLLEAFIKANKHLPDVPSAEDVAKNGIDLGDNQAVLLKKAEELTLYVIQQEKIIKEQEKKLSEQYNKMTALEDQLHRQQEVLERLQKLIEEKLN